MALGEIARIHRPVVHLQIDIDGVFGAPGRGEVRIPYSLQGWRKSAFSVAAAGKQEVAAIGLVEGDNAHIVRIFEAVRSEIFVASVGH